MERNVPQSEIASAFKKRARELHPDVNKAPDAEEHFKRLTLAYETLKDPQKRSRYDAFGAPRPRPTSSSKTNRQHRSQPNTGVGNHKTDDIRFERVETPKKETPFDFFLRREERKPKPREVELKIPLKSAFTGTVLNITIDLPDENGLTSTRRLKLKIPRGAKMGDRLHLKDPNIVVVLLLEKHPRFELDGRDLHTPLEIAPWDATLGGPIDIATPGGMIKMNIPPGATHGQTLRIKGQGLPQKPGKEGEPGDLYVELRIYTPKISSPRERELWESLKALAKR